MEGFIWVVIQLGLGYWLGHNVIKNSLTEITFYKKLLIAVIFVVVFSVVLAILKVDPKLFGGVLGGGFLVGLFTISDKPKDVKSDD